MKRRNFLAATVAGIISTKLFAQPSKSVIDNPPKGTSADPKKLPPITLLMLQLNGKIMT